MTKTFERFLRTFSDQDLVAFAESRGDVQPPYWRTLRLALQIELGRRGLSVDPEVLGPVVSSDPEVPSHRVIA